MHAWIPISCFVLNAWTNISIDIISFLKHCYPGAVFKSIEYISLKTSCLLRRIFSMNLPIRDDTGYTDSTLIAFDEIPIKIQIPKHVGFMFYNQMITYQWVVGTEKIIEELPKQKEIKKPVAPKMAFGRRVGEDKE